MLKIYSEDTFLKFRGAALLNEPIEILGTKFFITELKQGFNTGVILGEGFYAEAKLTEVIYEPD